jgi:glutathione S-transferase
LALEEAGAEYVDVARLPKSRGGGIPAMMNFIEGKGPGFRPFSPPFLRVGELVVSHVASILEFLGPRHKLVPSDESSQIAARAVQLTISDLVTEVHETHHPVAMSLYYEDQKREARKRTRFFVADRIPKYLAYFERLLERPRVKKEAAYLLGAERSYVDLSLFQVVAGLRYAFPKAMAKSEPKVPRVVSLAERIAARPRIAAYLESPRRIPFNEDCIFRRYPELER